MKRCIRRVPCSFIASNQHLEKASLLQTLLTVIPRHLTMGSRKEQLSLSLCEFALINDRALKGSVIDASFLDALTNLCIVPR